MLMRPLVGTLAAASVFALSIGSAAADPSGKASWRGGHGRHGHHGHDHDRHKGERWASSRWDRGSRHHDDDDVSRHRRFDHSDRNDHDDDDDDDDALAWLAITGLTLVTIGVLSQSQLLSYETAQTSATVAPLGESVIWRDGDAYGSVTPVREGSSNRGRYCREFLQTVTIGGREENAYGAACRDADGSWQVVTPAN